MISFDERVTELYNALLAGGFANEHVRIVLTRQVERGDALRKVTIETKAVLKNIRELNQGDGSYVSFDDALASTIRKIRDQAQGFVNDPEADSIKEKEAMSKIAERLTQLIKR